jgi:V/A-type H+/Na+-transporting ATPase subunit C
MRLENGLKRGDEMSSVVKYAAVNTKIRSMEGNLLSKNQLQYLIQSKDYSDALQYLKNETEYREVLKNFNLSDIHRGQLEVILRKNYVKNFSKLYHYFSGSYRKLFNILFMRFEIEDLKVIIRGKYIGKTEEDLVNLITYESPLNYINYKELIGSKDIEDLVHRLKNTPYYKYLIPLAKEVREEGLFRLEMCLDFVYFIKLRKFLKKIEKEDREVIQTTNGIYADLLNIQWIFRGKKYYKLSPEELLNFTIYDGYKLNKDTLKILCYTPSIEEFYQRVNKLPYGNIFEKSKYKEYLLEKEILVYTKKIYEKYKRENKLDISVVVAYLELSLLECRDIISIVENKRYNQNNEETLKYITATL